MSSALPHGWDPQKAESFPESIVGHRFSTEWPVETGLDHQLHLPESHK